MTASGRKVANVGGAGCWEWLGPRFDGDGPPSVVYGSVSYKGLTFSAHALMDFFERGPIPARLMIRHTCDNGLCVRPDHTVRGTHQDNMNDKIARARCRNQWTGPLA